MYPISIPIEHRINKTYVDSLKVGQSINYNYAKENGYKKEIWDRLHNLAIKGSSKAKIACDNEECTIIQTSIGIDALKIIVGSHTFYRIKDIPKLDSLSRSEE